MENISKGETDFINTKAFEQKDVESDHPIWLDDKNIDANWLKEKTGLDAESCSV